MRAEREWLSVLEAKTMLGLTASRVYSLLDEGKLAGQHAGKTWLVSRASCIARLELMKRRRDGTKASLFVTGERRGVR